MSKIAFFSVFTPIAVDDLSSPNILVDVHGFDGFAARGCVEEAGLMGMDSQKMLNRLHVMG
ncbi:MAG: hypothetical protein QW096_11065 [Thermofilaceae archaeon]